jgi:hypothetical protein
MWNLPDALAAEEKLPEVDELEHAAESSRQLHEQVSELARRPVSEEVQTDLEELAVAACFQELCMQKLLLLRKDTGRTESVSLANWRERLEHKVAKYRSLWHKRNKSSGWQDIETALSRMADAMSDRAR